MKNRASKIRTSLFIGSMLLVGMLSSGILQDDYATGTVQVPSPSMSQPGMPRIIIMEGISQNQNNTNSYFNRSPFLGSPVPFGSR